MSFKILKGEVKKYENRIIEFSSRNSSGAYSNLSPCQKYLFDTIQAFNTNSVLLRASIESAYDKGNRPQNCKFDARDSIITDFCYNMVNLEDNENKFLISEGRGRFKFVGFNWKPDRPVEISWNIQNKCKLNIGVYKNQNFEWDFSEIRDLIERSQNREL